MVYSRCCNADTTHLRTFRTKKLSYVTLHLTEWEPSESGDDLALQLGSNTPLLQDPVNASGISTVKCQHRCCKEVTRFLLVQSLFAELPAKLPSDAQAI